MCRPSKIRIKLIFSLVCALAAACLLNVGCASSHVLYNKNRKTVSNVWEGNFSEGKGFVPCNGSIEINRSRWMFGNDFYGIYFRSNAASPADFYFTMARNYN